MIQATTNNCIRFLTMGMQFHEAGQLSKAKNLYQKALEQEPNNTDAWHFIGLIHYQKNQSEQAVTCLENALTIKPECAELRTTLGNILHRQAKLREAEAAYKAAINNDPKYTEAHYRLGMLYKEKKQYARAAKIFQQLIIINPNDMESYNNLGFILHEQKKYAEAIEILQLALEKNIDVTTLNNICTVYMAQKKYKKALEYCRQALICNPYSAASHANLGMIHQAKREWDKAYQAYLKAVEIYPQFANIYAKFRELAYLFKDKKRYDTAILLFEKLIVLEPKETKNYTYLADIYYQQGATEKAKALYQQAMKLGGKIAGYQFKILAGKNVLAIPTNDVTDIFNNYADSFDEHLVKTLQYKTPSLLYQALISHFTPEIYFKKALDLGCGTGLVGLAFKKNIDCLYGVDLSFNMVEKARKRGIYKHLVVSDILEFLNSSLELYDLVMAADVFVYLGDLSKIFKAVQKNLTPDGCFIFSTESTKLYPYFLHAAGRFAHSKKYIKWLAAQHSLKIQFCQKTKLRKESGTWVAGDIFILKQSKL